MKAKDRARKQDEGRQDIIERLGSDLDRVHELLLATDKHITILEEDAIKLKYQASIYMELLRITTGMNDAP